jgi:anti-sigma regulatory factor (Ser/Thr protein kinase)
MTIMSREQPPSESTYTWPFLARAVLATPSAIGLLRDLAEVQLNKWGLAELVDDALLIVSELVTNACAAAPRTLIGFRMMVWPTLLVIEVYDSSGEPAVLQEPETLAESGRGLWIVSHLARHWGQRPEVGGGKTVYALLGLPAPPSAGNTRLGF